MKTRFLVEFGLQIDGRKGTIEFANMTKAAVCASELAFAMGSHDPSNHSDWFLLSRGRQRATWENADKTHWVSVTRVNS